MTACEEEPQPPTPTRESQPASSVLKGYGISPQGFPADFSRYAEFLQEVGGLPNGAVMFNGAWRQDAATSGQVPPTAAGLMQAASQYGYTPIIVFGWRSGDTQLHLSVPANAANDWGNQEARQLFRQMLVEFAAQYQPPYLFLGNESDGYYIANPADYARWLEFYNEAYDAVKAVSASTRIGPIFQYERMAGLGIFAQWTQPHWGALEEHDFAKIDVVGITLYPFFSFATPEEIPDNYLAALLSHTGGKPIAVTETGWPAENLGLEAPWEQSADAQVRYVDTLARISNGMNLALLNWLFIHPIQSADTSFEIQAFGSISLRDEAGQKRPVYDAWVNFFP